MASKMKIRLPGLMEAIMVRISKSKDSIIVIMGRYEYVSRGTLINSIFTFYIQ